MAERVYPSAKPNPPPAAAAATAAAGSSFPAPKPQMYQRPIYRPQAPAKRRRSCRCSFCCCFCWALLAVVLLALAAAVAGGAFYLLYRPQRPTFTVSSVHLAALNLTGPAAAPALTSSIAVTLTARNPNKKMAYLYDDITLSAATATRGVPLGSATVPGFAHRPGNTTVLAAALVAAGVAVDPAADVGRRPGGGLSVALDAETRAGVMVGRVKTRRIGIQVRCVGIRLTPPSKPAAAKKVTKGRNGTAVLAPAPAPSSVENTATTPATAATVAHSCTVRVRVKIWRWTF